MKKRTCSVPGCNRPSRARSWCTMHYFRWRTHGDPNVCLVDVGDGACRHCGDPVPTRSPRGGSAPLYCSPVCKSGASYQRRAESIREANRSATAERRATTEKTCKHCGEKFTPEKSMRQLFCSKACKGDHFRDDPDTTCAATDCDRPVRARNLCHMHYRAERRAAGEEATPSWTPERKARWLARAALKRGAGEAGKFTADEIYDRDGWVCGICDGTVDRDLAWPDPMSPSIDHVIPLAKGGDHLPENVQLAHLRCNISKGARVA